MTSTIIGAKRLSQLEDNLGALDITLTDDHRARLASKSAFDKHFPHNFLDNIRPAIQNGTTINAQKSDPWPLSPKDASERH